MTGVLFEAEAVTIRFACSACHTIHTAPAAAVGKLASCKNCRKRMRVPELASSLVSKEPDPPATRVEQAVIIPENTFSATFIWGFVFLLGGLLTCLYFLLLFETSVFYANTGNNVFTFDHMNMRSNGTLVGVGAMIAGAILISRGCTPP